jgi:hypothetical protein
MITFPAWVENPRDPELSDADVDAQLAQRRLRYMVGLAALHATPNTSIAALADHCKVERAHLHAAIREGRFSASIAAKIERACGRKTVRREWLIYPLEIHELAH